MFTNIILTQLSNSVQRNSCEPRSWRPTRSRVEVSEGPYNASLEVEADGSTLTWYRHGARGNTRCDSNGFVACPQFPPLLILHLHITKRCFPGLKVVLYVDIIIDHDLIGSKTLTSPFFRLFYGEEFWTKRGPGDLGSESR